MSKIYVPILAALLAVVANNPAHASKKEDGSKRDPEKAFTKLDANSDKKLSLDEFKARKFKEGREPEKIFKRKDKDGDGFLSLDEFKAQGKKKDANPT